MTVTLIVASTASNGIGIVEGATARLPWRLSKEMGYFARVTTAAPSGLQNAVIMGRRTWQSIPLKFRPLKNRLNVILSRDENFHESLHAEYGNTLQVHKHLTEALRSCEKLVHRQFIIGGASIYEEALQMQTEYAEAVVNRILITRILSPAFETCNVFFPNIHNTKLTPAWKRSSHQEFVDWLGFDVTEEVVEENGVKYEFQMWIRGINPGAASTI